LKLSNQYEIVLIVIMIGNFDMTHKYKQDVESFSK